MDHDYPRDADGDALRRVVADGSDMSKPMDVDFPVVISDETTARRFSEFISKHGYAAHLWHDDDDVKWDVICVKNMILDYDAVLEVQRHLNELSHPFGGYSDGWGTFGNK